MRPGRDSDLRLKGLGLRARFAVTMTLALVPVMALSAWLLHAATSRIAAQGQRDAIAAAVRFSADAPQERAEYEQGIEGEKHPTGVELFPFWFDGGTRGTVYAYPSEATGEPLRLSVPATEEASRALAGLFFSITAVVVLVGAAVAYVVAGRVVRPVQALTGDVRQIARGDVAHRTRSVGEGEIELLSRAIGRMTQDLEEARANELELSIRKRERELSARVREALLPLATPLREGLDCGAAFLSAEEFGGDFHDFIEREDGSLGLLVCDVSGTGIPAALVGATARSYLRSELMRSDDPAACFRRVNRWLAGDVRRGMFVTALYVLVDPAGAVAQVACAGHKLPLLRYDAALGKLRVVHPEGIAFGLDKGPVFDRRIQVVDTPLEPGDRFLLANSAPVELTDPAGAELGEKGFYARVLEHAARDTTAFLKGLRRDLQGHVGEAGVGRDVSLVTIAREG